MNISILAVLSREAIYIMVDLYALTHVPGD